MGQFRYPFKIVNWPLSTCLMPSFRILFLVRYFHFSFNRRHEVDVWEKQCGPECFQHRSTEFKCIKPQIEAQCRHIIEDIAGGAGIWSS